MTNAHKLQGYINFKGLKIAIENRKASIRRGADPDGGEWETRMYYPYGYIVGTTGTDGEGVDVFVGDDRESEKVFVIHINDPESKKYDEDKVMLGFRDEKAARDAFLAHYNEPHKFLRGIDEMTLDKFKEKISKREGKMIKAAKSFLSLLKSTFGEQLSLFGNKIDDEVITGKTVVKDGKTYQYKRSKKNPLVNRLMRVDDEQLDLFGDGNKKGTADKPKETGKPKKKNKISVFGEQLDLFSGQKEEKKEEKKEPKAKKPKKPSGAENISGGKAARKKKRAEINRKVRELLAEKSNEELTDEDLDLLRQYSGKGGTDLTSLNEYFTPSFVANFMWDKLREFGFKGGRVLEPSAGVGMFLETAPPDVVVTGVEFDETNARILNIFHGQDHDTRHGSFESFNAETEGGEFEAVIGNCPFGDRGKNVIDDPQLKDLSKHERYFVQRGIDDLKDGGIMAMIVPTGVMDNVSWNNWRADINKKAEFLGAIRMPTGAFQHAGAEVTTDIVFFRKRPAEARELLENLTDESKGRAYDEGVLDAEFISGSYFAKNPQYAIGEKTVGQFGMNIWKGKITPEELKEVGGLLKDYEDDYEGLKARAHLPELNVGDTKIINGRTYRLNENHRWERVDEEGQEEELPEELQEIFGVKTYSELDEIRGDVSKLLELERGQFRILGGEIGHKIDSELLHYTGKSDYENEVLKRAVILGLAVKQFQKDLQASKISGTEAQVKAAQIGELLKNFREEHGDPVKELGLMRYFRKTEDNPMIYLISSFGASGELSPMYDDPVGYYKIYKPNSEIGGYSENDLLSVVQYLFDNGMSGDVETIHSLYSETDDLKRLEKELIENENIFIDEDGNFAPLVEVCVGEVVPKLDAWEEEINKLSARLNQDLSDDDEYLIKKKIEKLKNQIEELKERAGFRELQDLPIDVRDAKKNIDIQILEDYLKSQIGVVWNSKLTFSPKTNMFGLEGIEGEAYLLFAQKGGTGSAKMDDYDKRRLKDLIDRYFDGNEQHPQLLLLNWLNGLKINLRAENRKKSFNDMIERIKSGFIGYLSALPEAEEIREHFNRLYNNYIHKTYDSSPIEGLSKFDYDKVVKKMDDGREITARDKAGEHTWATVRRMYEQGKGIIAHGVGLGKTLQGLILSLLAKETGRAKKPMIVTPKSVLKNWVAEIEKWTKDVNYIVVGSKRVMNHKTGEWEWRDESRAEKEAKLKLVETGDYDIVLMSRDTFKMIDFTEETKKRLVDEIVSRYYPGDPNEMDKKKLKKYERMQEKLAKLMSMRDSRNKYMGFEGVKMETLGVDMIIRDEAHDVKNLLISLGDSISGLSSADSLRAMHNFLASKVIFENNGNKGYYGLTATPISNSPLEVFNMMLPFASNELEKIDVHNMDEFIDRFANIDLEPTSDADGRVVEKNKFSGWRSPQALRNLFFRFVDYKTKDDVQSVKANIKFPDEKPNNVFTNLNEGQKELVEHCQIRLWTMRYKVMDGEKHDVPVLNEERMQSDVANGILSAEKRNAIEQHFNEEYLPRFRALNAGRREDDPIIDDGFFRIQSDLIKITSALEWYRDTSSHYGKEIDEDFTETHSQNYKLEALVENAVAVHKSGGKQLIFAINKELHNKIRDRLIEQGVPANEIVIVNASTAKSADKRVQISDDYNAGKYKVVIGNYATMGEGLNFQKDTSDIHHLQPTWNYLQIEQGNGRGIRQGNDREFVNTHYYLARGSIDNFMNTKIQEKGGMVDRFMRGEQSTWDDDVKMSLTDMMVELASNPEEARKLLENEQQRIEREMERKKKERAFADLDRYYTLKETLSKIDDKTSRRYQGIEKEMNEIKTSLKDVGETAAELAYNQKPIILKTAGVIVPVGSVLKQSDGNGFYVVDSYTPSTGRIVLKQFGGYENGRITVMKPHQFEAQYEKIFEKAGIETKQMYKELIDSENYPVSLAYQMPKDILKEHKEKIIDKFADTYGEKIFYETMDGEVKLDYPAQASANLKVNGGRYYFPQEHPDYILKAYKALKKLPKNERYFADEADVLMAMFGARDTYMTAAREFLKRELGDDFLNEAEKEINEERQND